MDRDGERVGGSVMTGESGDAVKPRNILVVAHERRDDALAAATRVARLLANAGARPVFADDWPGVSSDARGDDVGSAGDNSAADYAVLGRDVAVEDLELAIVLGGDGTILRAAELVRGGPAPVLGINMGHVGFLAEIDPDDMDDAVRRVIDRAYEIEDRLALEVRVKDAHGAVIFETWALNEATVEKASRERSLEVVIEVDRLPLSSFGCDGVVIATPTGSTAYNFSAGGPVIWPSVEAIAVVPLSAHALFARPLVVGPEASVAIELLERSYGLGVLWCDGRRSFDLPAGARVVARRSATPVRIARLHPAPFGERLVRKFRLPVAGWRGPIADSPTGALPVITGSADGASLSAVTSASGLSASGLSASGSSASGSNAAATSDSATRDSVTRDSVTGDSATGDSATHDVAAGDGVAP